LMFLRLLMTNHFLYGFHSHALRLRFVDRFDRRRNRLRIRNLGVGRLLRLLLLLALGISFECPCERNIEVRVARKKRVDGSGKMVKTK
jgi:hypothetical protein